MLYLFLCASVFLCAYLLNITYISVFYHRGLAHQSLTIKPWIKNFIVRTGPWITGIDPKGWVIMHRFHHRYSDTPLDPHSPVQVGFLGVAIKQLKYYERVLSGIKRQDPKIVAIGEDLQFPINWLNQKKVWVLPYVLHLLIAAFLGYKIGVILGVCYYVGIMSHPIQGWMVNAFGHAVGYRNFNLPDNSRNNTLVAWLVLGEGYQNNHHRFPESPKFSFKWWEVDAGYLFCLLFKRLGLVDMQKPDTVADTSLTSLIQSEAP